MGSARHGTVTVGEFDGRLKDAHVSFREECYLPDQNRKVSVTRPASSLRISAAEWGRKPQTRRKRNFLGQHFWARGYFVNTVGRDEEAIRAYIRNQEKEDQRLEQLNLWR